MFKKTVWPLLIWELAHTRPFVMSILDLVGISKLASLYMKKKTLLYYIVFIIGVASVQFGPRGFFLNKGTEKPCLLSRV